MSSSWLESSRPEIELSRAIALKLSGECGSVDAICRIMEDLALYLAAGATDSPTNVHPTRWLDTLQHEFPELAGIKITQPFPDEITDLTANLFSRLAYELEVERGNPISHGVVGTPAILA